MNRVELAVSERHDAYAVEARGSIRSNDESRALARKVGRLNIFALYPDRHSLLRRSDPICCPRSSRRHPCNSCVALKLRPPGCSDHESGSEVADAAASIHRLLRSARNGEAATGPLGPMAASTLSDSCSPIALSGGEAFQLPSAQRPSRRRPVLKPNAAERETLGGNPGGGTWLRNLHVPWRTKSRRRNPSGLPP